MCSEMRKKDTEEKNEPAELAIRACNLTKVYPIFDKPVDRLKQYLWRNKRQFYKPFVAVSDVSFELKKGDILGVVGRNGSGKSTLLQLICGTLSETSGELTVNGRIAALLELGSGFNPEFTGRENIFLNASILGLSKEEITRRYDDIVAFSGIGAFIDQPVKTYSSGMYVRLAFSVAVSVDPDILIIDEALSVGDGAFSRQSFERIMNLKEAGKTILFCSHSLYQIEALCNKAIWLENGQIKKQGSPADVVVNYNNFLESLCATTKEDNTYQSIVKSNSTHFKEIKIVVNGSANKRQVLMSQQSDLSVIAHFISDMDIPIPNVVIAFFTGDGRIIASSSTRNDNYSISRDAQGKSNIEVHFKKIPLLKGHYYIDLFLACENAIHVYEHAAHVAELEVVQDGLEQGVFAIEHEWRG
jgi:lipopolysaccharide transport system ATP-binding protein